jgi:hypothetical protein
MLRLVRALSFAVSVTLFYYIYFIAFTFFPIILVFNVVEKTEIERAAARTQLPTVTQWLHELSRNFLP